MNGEDCQAAVNQVLRDYAEDDLVIPAQALAELFTVLTRKASRSAEAARAAVLGWYDACPIADTSTGVLVDAMELAVRHRFASWDAIMLAAAAASGCRYLLSKDQNGSIWALIRYFLSEAHDLVNVHGTRLRQHTILSTGAGRVIPEAMLFDR